MKKRQKGPRPEGSFYSPKVELTEEDRKKFRERMGFDSQNVPSKAPQMPQEGTKSEPLPGVGGELDPEQREAESDCSECQGLWEFFCLGCRKLAKVSSRVYHGVEEWWCKKCSDHSEEHELGGEG